MQVGMKTSAFAGLLLSLSACAGSDGRYPSLALRPFETGVVTAPPASPPAPIRPAADPATLANLRARAATAHAAFMAARDSTARLARAATGQPLESRQRAAALVAMADLASKRGATVAVLADLDVLRAGADTALAPDPAIAAAQAEVTALMVREDEALAQLWEIMGS